MTAAATTVGLVTLPAGRFAVLRRNAQVHLAAATPDGPCGVTAESLLGELLGFRVVPHYPDLRFSRVEAMVVPYGPDQQAAVFTELWETGGAGCEIAVPVTPTTSDGAEWVLDTVYWAGADLAELDDGERHVRAELSRHVAGLPAGAVVLDPACSTGACLAHIGNDRPDLPLIGHDLAAPMVEVARGRLGRNARITPHDARQPFDVRADLCVCRCATHTVLTRADADLVLDRCIEALADGGTLVLTGVTAPHHLTDDLTDRGLEVLQATARDHVRHMIFPFYRARRAD